MAKTKPQTVKDYLEQLPEDRRAVVSAVRQVIRKHLPAGYREAVNYGVISYEIPLDRYPNTYNGQPLSYIALGAKKNHFALYLMCLYMNESERSWLCEQFKKAGKKLDMGKACLRFRALDDLPLDAIARIVALATPDQYIARYEAGRRE